MSDEAAAKESAEHLAEELTTERKWPMTVPLAYPVEFDGETISSLVFRRGCMGDLRGLRLESEPPMDHLMLVASRMCGQNIKVIERLADIDGAEVIAIALGFWLRSLAGGKRR